MKHRSMAQSVTAIWLVTSTIVALSAPTGALEPPVAEVAKSTPSSLWSRLWRTPDQRGQALMKQGNAAGAAQTFVDPLHKGHASLQARDYAGAAKTLTGIDTTEAHYNRGNALAHTGDLQGAINEYDMALKQNPQHTDARHNREVVAAAMKKQKDEKKSDSEQDKQKKDKPEDKKDKQAGDKPDGKADAKQDGQEGKDGKGSKPGDSPSEPKSDKSGPKPSDTPGKQDADKPGQPPADKPKPAEPPSSTPQAGSQPVPEKNAASSKDDAAQAKRDAESALGKGAPPPTQTQPGAAESPAGKAEPADAVTPPMSEKQIAQEQWLRAIPDDPGGLLRRKFLIEHMLRQQGQKQ